MSVRDICIYGLNREISIYSTYGKRIPRSPIFYIRTVHRIQIPMWAYINRRDDPGSYIRDGRGSNISRSMSRLLAIRNNVGIILKIMLLANMI